VELHIITCAKKLILIYSHFPRRVYLGCLSKAWISFSKDLLRTYQPQSLYMVEAVITCITIILTTQSALT